MLLRRISNFQSILCKSKRNKHTYQEILWTKKLGLSSCLFKWLWFDSTYLDLFFTSFLEACTTFQNSMYQSCITNTKYQKNIFILQTAQEGLLLLKYVEEKRQESRNNILWCRINYSTALSRPSYLEKNITMTYGPNVWEVKRTQLFVHTENISKLKTVAPSQLRFHAFLPILTAYVKLKVKEGRKRVTNEKAKKKK